MRKFLLILLGLVVVLIGAALIVPFLVPTDTYKQQIARQVESATGRRLTIDGPLKFTILPRLSLEATGVTLANPPGASTPDMVRLKTLQLNLGILPLLSGTLEIDRFVLVEPEIVLEVDAEGKPNWQFGTPTAEPTPQPEAQPETQPEAKAPAGGGVIDQASGGMLSEVKLGDIRIENGSLTYSDAQGGSEQLSAINMTLLLPDLKSPLQAEGALDYKGQTITLQLDAQAPAALLDGGSSPVALNVTTTPAEVRFDGELAAGAAPAAAGKLDLKVSSIRDLAAWLAEPIAFEGDGLNSLEIAGQLDAGPQKVALSDATVALDAISGTAALTADIAGPVPKVTGQLDLGAVDLDPYLPPEAEQGSGDQGGDATAGGWSKEPIALPPLDFAEVDFALSLQSLTMQGIDLGKTALTLKLADGTLSTALKEMALYGGNATGTVTVAAADGVPAISQNFQLDGLNALPFFTAVADFDRLEGEVDAKLDLTTRGGSELQLVQGLNGNGSFAFTDGALVGINIAAMVRNAADAFLNPTAGEVRKTDFSELSATFDITNGILANDDLSMQTPGLRVSGQGRADLPARTVSYVVEPKAAATLEGQSGSQDVAGVLVPVLIQGPWNNLTYTPDPAALLDAALNAPETIEQLGDSAKDVKRALKKGDAEALIKGLTGAAGGSGSGDGSGGGESSGSVAEDAAKQLLNGLFNK